MREKRHRILPHFNLCIRLHRASRDHDNRKHLSRNLQLRRVSHRIPDQPHNDNKKTNQRNISIAFSHGLLADLHDANNRRQRSQKPQPADEAIRLILAKMPANGSYRDKSRKRQSRRDITDVVKVVVIIDGKRIGPERNPHITPATDCRVQDSIRQWQKLKL